MRDVLQYMAGRNAPGGPYGPPGVFFGGRTEAQGVACAYATSVGAPSLDSLRALPAVRLLGGNAIRIAHPVLEPYALPRSPSDAHVNGEQLDVPVTIGSNAQEAQSLVDMSRVRTATFDSDITAQFGALSPHTRLRPTPMRARRDSTSTATCDSAGKGGLGHDCTPRSHALVYAYRFERRPPFPVTRSSAGFGGRAISRSCCGICPTTWI